MSELLAGLALGMAAGIAPGPLQALVLTSALEGGFAAGRRVAIAPLLSDVPVVIISLLALSAIPDAAVTGLGLVGGIVVLVMAAAWLRSPEAPADVVRPASRDYRRGVLVNLLSPHPWIFWAVVGGPLLVGAWQRSPGTAVAFLGGFYTLLVGSKVALAWVVARGGRSLDQTVRRRLTVGGVALLAVAGLVLIGEAATGRLV